MGRHGNDPAPITRSDIASYRRWAETRPIDTAYRVSSKGKPATITYAFEENGYRYRVTEVVNPNSRLITLKTMRKAKI